MFSTLLTLWLALSAGAEAGGMADAEPAVPNAAGRVELGPISLLIPPTWQHRFRAGTNRFDSPKGDAYFVVDTGEVKTAGMEPSICLGKITEALGADGGEWHKLILGGFPAAHRSNVDVGKGGSVTVRTHTFVGCDGMSTWSILFHLDDKAADKYEKEVVALAKSLEFTKPAAAPVKAQEVK